MNPDGEVLRIGGSQLDRADAFEAAADYLSGTGGYSYPGYDAFDGGSCPSRLSDGDLLAPVVLNVRLTITAFYTLQRLKPALEGWLATTPPDASLTACEGEGLLALGELFGLLDDHTPGVRGTTLAKVMHRKRPGLVPLYDGHIWWTYVGAPEAAIPRSSDRLWRDFMPLLASAMKEDMHRESEWLDEIRASATAVAITPLRALDIVAWRAGALVKTEAMKGRDRVREATRE